MRVFLRLVTITTLLLAPFETLALSGNELNNHCTNEYKSGFSYCLGYISRVVDADEAHYVARVTYSQAKAKEEETTRQKFSEDPSFGQLAKSAIDHFFLEKRDYCLPAKSTLGQIKAVFQKYLSANPEKTHLPADHLIRESLGVAFPCK